MKTLAKFTTSQGNEIEIYTTSIIGDRGCVVLDRSCQLERTYWIGKEAHLTWEQLENGYEKIKSISQVIKAWKNEQIHF